MGFIQSIINFIHSLIPSGAEGKKRQELRKIEIELRSFTPTLYKNGFVQANFAEAFNILYKNVKPIDDILTATVCSNDVSQNNKFIDRLLMTGFTPETQAALGSLEYENRQIAIEKTKLTITRFFDEEHRKQEQIIKELNSEQMKKMDDIISGLKQLSDVCKYNYINVIHIFDPDYTARSDYKPVFPPMPPDPFADVCADLYYLTADFRITKSLGRAVEALAKLSKGGELTLDEKDKLMCSLRRVGTVFRRLLTPTILKQVTYLARHTTDVTFQTASYTNDSRKKFIALLQAAFVADENRLKVEMKDKTISSEIKDLFGDKKLLELNGYNIETDNQLRQSSPSTFLWVTPMQILKTFVHYYYDEHIQALLNDIVIEGFFDNPSYKSDFSSIVFTCNEAMSRIQEFEDSFNKGNKNDVSIFLGYIRDSNKDPDFLKKLEASIDVVNVAAKDIIQQEAEVFFQMHKLIGTLLLELKSSTVSISNLKMLFTSSRNKDNAGKLEREYSFWKIFLEIMKNYAIIGEVKEQV